MIRLLEKKEFTQADFDNYIGPKDPLFQLWIIFNKDPSNLTMPLSLRLPLDPQHQKFSLIPYETPPGSEYGPSGDWCVTAVRPSTGQLGGLDRKTLGE